MKYTVELNLPPACASANYRGQSLHKARPIARYRGDCGLRFRVAKIPPLTGLVTIHLEYYLSRKVKGLPIKGRYYPLDDDGAIHGAKSARDALQDAGIVPCDSMKYVRVGSVKLYRRVEEHNGRACLVMTLEVEE